MSPRYGQSTKHLASRLSQTAKSTIVSEGFKGGTRGAPIMPRDAVSRTANVELSLHRRYEDLASSLRSVIWDGGKFTNMGDTFRRVIGILVN